MFLFICVTSGWIGCDPGRGMEGERGCPYGCREGGWAGIAGVMETLDDGITTL